MYAGVSCNNIRVLTRETGYSLPVASDKPSNVNPSPHPSSSDLFYDGKKKNEQCVK